MPPRPSHLPSYFERLGLEAVLKGQTVPSAVSQRTVLKMLEKGWIERNAADEQYSITEAGIDAMRRKIPTDR